MSWCCDDGVGGEVGVWRSRCVAGKWKGREVNWNTWLGEVLLCWEGGAVVLMMVLGGVVGVTKMWCCGEVDCMDRGGGAVWKGSVMVF